jgi:hypothetical protein
LQQKIYNNFEIVAYCNTITTLDEFYEVLQKIQWVKKNDFLDCQPYQFGYVIEKRTNIDSVQWSEKGKEFLLTLINFVEILPFKMNLEFIQAKFEREVYTYGGGKISLDLARLLYKVKSRELIYNDESYTSFSINEDYIVFVKKYNNVADECYLEHKRYINFDITEDNLFDYFDSSIYDDSEYDEPDYEGDEYGTINGKVYLSGGVWIDRKDVWW